MSDYNYAVFDMQAEKPNQQAFPNNLHVGERAPDFPLEDLESGGTVPMTELWARDMVILEFGSFT